MISKIIDKGIGIMSKEIDSLEGKDNLDREESDKLVNFIKTLISIEKERRTEKEQASELTDKELEDEILKEAQKIKELRGNKTTITQSKKKE